MGDQVIARPLPVYKHRKTHTHTQTPNVYALSGIRTHNPGFRDSATVTSVHNISHRICNDLSISLLCVELTMDFNCIPSMSYVHKVSV
jgi:hypothetical protein